MVALDTTPAAKVRPGSREHVAVLEQHRLGTPYAVTSAVVLELLHGMERHRGNPAWDAQREFLGSLLGAGLLVTLPFGRRAAAVATRLRALMPYPPANTSSKTAPRSKADHRVAWVLDLQTAATVYVMGGSLASDDRHHRALADALAGLTGYAAHSVTRAPF